MFPGILYIPIFGALSLAALRESARTGDKGILVMAIVLGVLALLLLGGLIQELLTIELPPGLESYAEDLV